MLSSNSDTGKGLLCYLTAFLCFKTLWDILSISQIYRSWVYSTTPCFPLPYRFISVFLYCGSNTHRIVLILFHDFDFLLRYYVYNRNQLKDYPKLYITILLLFSSKLFSVIFIMLFHFQTFDVFECCDKPFW